MNNDLISRSELIEFLKAVIVTDGITFETGFKQIITDIKNQPTAYDVDRVVEKLVESSEQINELDEYNDHRLKIITRRMVDIRKAIDIVKKGGV